MALRALTVLVSFILTSNCYAAVAKNCGIPVNVPGTMLDVPRFLGRWYEFMYRTPPMEDENCINNYVPVGLTPISNSPIWGVTVSWTITFYVEKPSRQCMGLFNLANFTANGKKTGVGYFPGVAQPMPMTYTVLFTDYKTMELSYRCNSIANDNPTGNCTDPYFFLNVRTRPTDLRPVDKTMILQKVDSVLSPFCFGSKDLNNTGQNWQLPSCNPPPPQALSRQVQNLRSTLMPYPTELAVS